MPIRSAAAVLVSAAFLSSGAFAQHTPGAPEGATPTTGASGQPPAVAQARQLPGPDVAVTLFGTHAFEADFEDVNGSVSLFRTGAEVGIRQPLDERTRLSLSIGAEYSGYDFSSDTALAGTSEPWDDTYQLSAAVIISRQATTSWSWFFGGGADASFEDDANLGKSFTGGLVAGANYKVNENLTLGGGFAARSRLEDSGLFLPLVSIDWKISEQWTLSNSNELNSTGIALAYRPNEQLQISLHGAYQGRAYRLDEDGPIPDGVGRDSRIPVWLQVRYSFSPRISVTVAGGYIAWQEYTVDDNNGNELDQQGADGTPFVGASLVFLF
ncbi:MAG TPA: DUF6268 family outer membrane beta-barrel protein [Phycisphaerales bacterium]|nr:DUF6268 family outer membrane beta-barrel protein [Phycisphaerales bacterium]